MAIAKQTTATVIPALQYQDASAAIDFLCKAFGFEKKAVYEGEVGSIAHAELTLGNGMVMLGSAKETDYGKLLVRPRQVGGVTMSTYCIVADPDAHFARAKAAGKSLLVISHDADYYDVADRLIRLQDGRLLEECTLEIGDGWARGDCGNLDA